MQKLLILAAIFFAVNCRAQTAQVSVDGNGRAVNVPENYTMFVNTVKPDNIVGSPLFMDQWVTGDVFFEGNHVARGIPVQIDLEKNLVYFQQNDNRYQFVVPVLKCMLQASVNGKVQTIVFSSDYPVYKSEKNARFYLVLTETQTVHLLKHTVKRIRETYVYSKPAEREYVASEELFIYNISSKTLHAVSNKKSVLAALPEQKERIDTLCRENGWSLKTAAEISKLIIQLH
jgi:hypothetical protein